MVEIVTIEKAFTFKTMYFNLLCMVYDLHSVLFLGEWIFSLLNFQFLNNLEIQATKIVSTPIDFY